MSKSVSALQGETYAGYVTVEEQGLRGMITLRGDLSMTALKNAVTGLAGVDMPGLRQINTVGEKGVAWMSPDELLILLPYDEVADGLGVLATALGGAHALAVNVSDARVMFKLRGPGAREVIAKLAPVDMARLTPGEMRRSRLAQVPAAFWLSGEEEITLIAFRSVARYVFDLLSLSARPGGEVGVF